MNEPRFLADRTVGRLAKWLRLLGLDCAYNDGEQALDIIIQAKNERRVIVTKNTQLMALGGDVEHLFIDSDLHLNQLKYVISKYNITISDIKLFTICSLCNERLLSIAPDAARGQVPPYVFATQTAFRQCPKCHRIYWGGTHKSRMLEKIKSIFSLSNVGKSD